MSDLIHEEKVNRTARQNKNRQRTKSERPSMLKKQSCRIYQSARNAEPKPAIPRLKLGARLVGASTAYQLRRLQRPPEIVRMSGCRACLLWMPRMMEDVEINRTVCTWLWCWYLGCLKVGIDSILYSGSGRLGSNTLYISSAFGLSSGEVVNEGDGL